MHSRLKTSLFANSRKTLSLSKQVMHMYGLGAEKEIVFDFQIPKPTLCGSTLSLAYLSTNTIIVA
jgi:hypothetical protein